MAWPVQGCLRRQRMRPARRSEVLRLRRAGHPRMRSHRTACLRGTTLQELRRPHRHIETGRGMGFHEPHPPPERSIMTKLEQAARQALGALEVATTPLTKDRQEVLRAITTLREALSGVQALSAAPVEQEEAAQRLRKTLDIDPGDVNDPLHPRYIAGFKSGHAAGRRRAAPAASPTPPAEQPEARNMACQKLQRTVAALVGHGASLLLPL